MQPTPLPNIGLLGALGLLATAIAAQDPPDWRLPFRSPQANVVPPEAMFAELQPMFAIAQATSSGKRRFENGVEVVDDPQWQKHRDKLATMNFDAGYLSVVIRESQHPSDRRIAFFGAFYCPIGEYVMNLIGHIPGEPVRALREEAFARAVEWLAAHFDRRNPGDLEEWVKLKVGPAAQKPPRPGDYTFDLDLVPFVALLNTKEAIDQRQVLWFLARCIDIRKAFAPVVLDATRQRLAELITNGDQEVRAAIHDLLTAMEPKPDRVRPRADGEPAELQSWLAAIDHDLFPPIRRISAGRYEFFEGPETAELIRVGKEILASGEVGDTRNGRTKTGTPYRGFRIAKLPPPLDQIGIEPGWVVVGINGAPIATLESLRRAIEQNLAAKRGLFVEFIDPDGVARGLDFVPRM
ncbi:MAG: hypothetical protein AB7I19_07170 [Planctomycetota bacterium]